MTKRDGTQAKYTVLGTDERGEIRLYEDGSKRDSHGALREILDTNIIITPEIARQFNARRKQKILDAIESKIQDITRTNAPAEAIAAIVGKRAQIAMSDETRTGNEAAKIVLQAVDAYQQRTADDRTNVLRHEYHVDEETRALLHEMIQQRRDDAIIDAEEYRDNNVGA
jgi:hypothetical protein